jgi:hypothetical protein
LRWLVRNIGKKKPRRSRNKIKTIIEIKRGNDARGVSLTRERGRRPSPYDFARNNSPTEKKPPIIPSRNLQERKVVFSRYEKK